MKLDDSSSSSAMPTATSSPNFSSKTFLNNKLSRQSSSASSSQRRNRYMTYQRRHNAAATSNDFLNQHSPSKISVPLLSSTMNEFFHATKIMEDEIMLPSRLKDMPVEGKTHIEFSFFFLNTISSLFSRICFRQFNSTEQLA